MTVTLNLTPEVEAALLAHAQASGSTLEEYLRRLIEVEVSAGPTEAAQSEASGMVWENGLFVYRTGKPLPGYVVDDAIRRSREERTKQILGDLS